MVQKHFANFILLLAMGLSGCTGVVSDGSAAAAPETLSALTVTKAKLSSNQVVLTGSLLDQVQSLALTQDGQSLPLKILTQTSSQLTAALTSSATITKLKTLTLLLGTANAATTVVLTVDLSGTTISHFSSTGMTDLATSPTLFLSAGNLVGIGTASPLSALDVSGGVAIGTYAGGSAAPVNGLIASGKVGIGTSTPSYPLEISQSSNIISSSQPYPAASYVGTTLSPGADSSANLYGSRGMVATSISTVNYTGALVNGSFEMDHNGSGTVATSGGLQGIVQNNLGGTITTARGVDGWVQNFAGGTISNAVGVRAQVLNSAAGGTITNSYEVYTSTTNSGTITNKYGIYQSSTGVKNYLAGTLGIGTNSPGATLDVKGHVANSGLAATVGSCGTGATISGNDARGLVNVGTGAVTGCGITFNAAYSSTPVCTVSWSGATVPAAGISSVAAVGALAVYFSASSPSTSFSYTCVQ